MTDLVVCCPYVHRGIGRRAIMDSKSPLRRKYSEFKLLIFGDGELREELQQYINRKGLEDKIILYHSTSDVHERIKDAYMFVSSSDFEGLSNSMLEAMAMGIPTVCTDCPCGGARMVIQDGRNGLLIPVGNREKLVDAMERIINDRKLANSLSLESRKIRTLLSENKIVGQWLKLV